MRTYDKKVVKAGAITFVTALFLLILLPAALVTVWNAVEDRGETTARQDQTSDGEQQAVQQPGSIDSDAIRVAVFRTQTQTVEEIPLEDYVLGVTASEMPASFHIEALRAQAVAARTYALAKVEKSASGNSQAHPLAPLCDGTHCQVFRTEKELLQIKGQAWMDDKEAGLPQVKQAVQTTKGQVMYYQGELVQQPLFHSASGERTENSEDVFTASVPYLRSVESGEYEDGAYEGETVSMGLSDFIKKAAAQDGAAAGAASDTIRILSRSEGGRVERMQVGGATFSGREIRELFGLRSANFTVEISAAQITFTTFGNGHGVGMSQYGANGMGQAGNDYRQILGHYYSGIEVK